MTPSGRETPAAPVAKTRRRARLPLGLWGAAVLLIGAGAAGWRWHVRTGPAAAPAPALLSPAQARLLAAAAREPRNPRPYQELAELCAGAGQPASALWAETEAAARAPRDPGIALKQAELMARMSYRGPAEAALRPLATGKTAAAAPARRDLAEILISTGRPAAALPLLRGAGSGAETLRGRALEAMGDDAGAAAAYRRAAAAGDPEGCERRARLDLARGHLPAARQAMQALATLRAVQPADLLLVAAIHAAAGTPGELATALARLHRCLELEPRDVEVHYQAALLLRRTGDRVAAVNELERAVALDPNRVDARVQLADLLQAMGQAARAHRERAFVAMLKDQPDRAFAEFSLARAAARTAAPSRGDSPADLDEARMVATAAGEAGQRGTALRQAQADVRRDPDDTAAWLELGLLLQDDPARAPLERVCRQWIAHQPACGLPYWFLGDQALRDTRTADAIHAFQIACKTEPDRADFRTALGLSYLTIDTPENRARARSLLEKAIALNPRSPAPYQHLGMLFAAAGDLDGARCADLRSLDLQPDQPIVLNALVSMLGSQGRTAAAGLFAGLARFKEGEKRERERLTRRARQHPGRALSRLELARFLIRHGELEAARYQLERAAETGPSAAPARQALAGVDRLLRVAGTDDLTTRGD